MTRSPSPDPRPPTPDPCVSRRERRDERGRAGGSPGALVAAPEAPLVTVIVPYDNQGAYLPETLESLDRQTFQGFEVILVDDGSDDARSLRILAEAQARWPGLRVITQPNRGLREVRGQFILPLDADDLLAPTYIEKTAWALVTRPDVGFVYTGVREFGAGSAEGGSPFDPGDFAPMNAWPCCALIRRAVFERVGGYRDVMRLGREHRDFWIGVLEAGIKGHGIPEPLVFSRRRPGAGHERDAHFPAALTETLRAQHPAASRRPAASRPPPGAPRGARALLIRLGRRLLPEAIKVHLGPVAHGQQTLRGFVGALLGRNPAAGRLDEPPVPAFVAQYEGREDPAVDAAITESFGRVAPRSAEGRRRNILFLVPWFEVGGSEQASLEILRRLDRERFRPFVIATVPSAQPWRRRFEACTPEVFALPAFLPGPYFERFVADFVAARGVDLLQVSNTMHGYAYLRGLRQRFPRLKTLDLLHSVPMDEGGYPGLSARHFTADLDRHVVVSRHLQGFLRAHGVPDAKVRVCPLGVDARDEFDPARHEPGRVRTALGLSPEADVVAFVGRLAWEKRPLVFLDIAEAVLDRGDVAAHFVLVGDGVLRRAVARRVARSRWRDRLHLLGNRTDIPQILRDTTVLVVPSEFEGIARISYEALAMGVPNLASDVGGQGELITAECGRLIPRGRDEVAAFARELRDLLGDRARLAAMRAAARARVLERFDVTDFVRSLEAVWDELA